VREQLERVAFSEATSGRAKLAKVTALRALERRRRGGREQIPPCPPDWRPQAGTDWEELDRVYLAEHPECASACGATTTKKGDL
jgi:hypothetical protein